MRRCTTIRQGASIDTLDLGDFIGPARVIDARGSEPLCGYDEIASALDGAPPRLLFRLMDRGDELAWPTGFRALAPETVERLALRGTRLIGVDVPSVDPETSKSLPSHMVCRRHDLRIVENLVLADVAPGDYELIALPLKLQRSRCGAGSSGAQAMKIAGYCGVLEGPPAAVQSNRHRQALQVSAMLGLT